MKKKHVFKLLVVCFIAMFAITGKNALAVSAANAQETKETVKVLFNGAELDLAGQNPYVHYNNLMLPVQSIVEEFGATVTRDGAGNLLIA